MKVFLDQDGPLADFDKKMLQTFGTLDVPDGLMWRVINKYEPNWFIRLEPAKDMNLLWSFFKNYNPTILTATPRTNRDEVARQKRDWVDLHLGKEVPVIACRRVEKQNYCTGPDCVLIDDNIKNIEEWAAKGGIAIYHTSAEKSIYLFNILTARFTSL